MNRTAVTLATGLALALVLALPGLVQPPPASAQQGVAYSATGSGKISLHIPSSPGNELFNLSFSALMGSDGITRGQLQAAVTGTGQQNLRFHVDIFCLVVNGNTAHMGGIITQASDPQFVGRPATFSVMDGGEGQGAADQMSVINFGQVLLCTPQPTGPIEKGNIQVRPLE